MTQLEFLELLKEAGFKNLEEFANELNFSLRTVEGWIKTSRYPVYIQAVLKCAIKARKIKELEIIKEDNYDKGFEEKFNILKKIPLEILQELQQSSANKNKINSLFVRLNELENENSNLKNEILAYKQLKNVFLEFISQKNNSPINKISP